MSIRAQASTTRQRLPLTINVGVNDEIFISDYAPGRAVTHIRNDDSTITNDLTLRINCIVKTATPNTGLVDTPVRILDLSLGSEVIIGGLDTSPEGMIIESFKVISSDSGAIDITVW